MGKFVRDSANFWGTDICRKINTSLSRIVLKDIITLKNQQEVYLVQDDEGDFLYQNKKY